MTDLVLGVDVGTASARAGLFDLQGVCMASMSEPFQIWRPRPNFVEQSSEDIWRAVCAAVHSCVSAASVSPSNIVGVSFDATCSLVVLDSADSALTVDLDGDPQRNVIVWMDHRALAETEEINAGRYEVLRYVGGALSPEMETPKLKWLKRNLPETWKRANKFFDLADYLTYRSCGSTVRSLCTTVCKWTYLGHEGTAGKWDRSYFEGIDLADALDGDRIGSEMRSMGSPLGKLTAQAAADLGLTTECAVGVGIIDAHAGGVGLLGSVWPDGAPVDIARLETALALIGGTSNCHMAVSRQPQFIPGIWGPYYSAMVPGMWLTEGGQSTAGSAIDYMIGAHANSPSLRHEAAISGATVYEILNREVEALAAAAGVAFPGLITRDTHVLPYFLGNRSPNADPYAVALIEGLTLDENHASLATLYYATIQGVAYGTRDIIRAMNASGYRIDTIYVTGGSTKNPLWLQEHADATGLTLVLPAESDAVLLGTAILAAVAAGAYESVPAAMHAMSATGRIVRPNPLTRAYHEARYAIFRELYAQQKLRRAAMSAF